jgi:hypothetical protein
LASHPDAAAVDATRNHGNRAGGEELRSPSAEVHAAPIEFTAVELVQDDRHTQALAGRQAEGDIEGDMAMDEPQSLA